MKCLNCEKEISVTEGHNKRKYCNGSCRTSYFRKKDVTEGSVLVEEKDERVEEQELQSIEIEGETPNARYAREYREFQKKWIKGSCDKFEDKGNGKCKKCKKPFERHHEARYRVFHEGV